jgi:hypothetical protein
MPVRKFRTIEDMERSKWCPRPAHDKGLKRGSRIPSE